MKELPKYTDDDHDRLQREAEQMVAEAEAALARAQDVLAAHGLDPDDTRLSEFLSGAGPSAELDALRAEVFDGLDVQDALFAEEKRLRAELAGGAAQPAAQTRRRHRARV